MVEIGMAIDENGLRAELGRGAQRHGGVHAKLAGRVRCCGDHAALVALAAHHDGFSLERGVEELFHGDEKGVHIDVEDQALHMVEDTIGMKVVSMNLWPSFSIL